MRENHNKFNSPTASMLLNKKIKMFDYGSPKNHINNAFSIPNSL